MNHFQQKAQNYSKWDDSIWLSVEKEISLFQKKVTDCMLILGDINKNNADDFKIEPCLEDDVILGQEFYVQMIRPFCVTKGYLPKKIPTQEEVSDIFFDEELERESEIKEVKVEEVKEKKGKKGGKSNQNTGNDEKMKMKIVKDNFQKDIDLVIKSHSLERMQVEFGLKHKKLQLKLMTFFYVAYYIRKNKVNQKIDQAEIFELINILIKMVRIFSRLQGPSFLDSSKKIEVSPSLILDLKCCIKQLKNYYYYTNKTIIIKYPKLVYYTNYDKFFPTLDIKPYPSQIQFIQAVKSAFNEKGNLVKPTLIFYRTMIGSGKTSASLALSQLIHQCKLADNKNNNLQVVYTCLISSVRVQVGRYCYNKEQKFALAAMEKSIKDQNYYYPRIINSWSCRDEKVVDLIISDPHCTYEMLDRHKLSKPEEDIMDHQMKNRKKAVNRGKLDRENVILFVDEPTAFCKDTESRSSRKIFDILSNHPPKLIILASATMPSQKQLEKTVQLVRRKNPDLQVIQVDSKEFQIGCQYCSFKGQVIFPHTGVKNKEELTRIIEILKKNAFLLKLYTGPSLFFLLKKCEDMNFKNLPKIDSLPEVRQEDITKATFKILEMVVKETDEVIEKVCALAKDETIMDFKHEVKKDSEDEMFDFMESKEKEEDNEEEKEDYVNFKRMLRGDAYKFLGGCLIGTSDPIGFAHKIFERWVKDIKPIKRLMEKYEKDYEELDKKIRLLEDDTEMREEKKTQKISKLQSDEQPTLDFPEKKKINTTEHYQRYCKNKQPMHNTMLIKPVPLENVGKELIEEVDDFILKLLFCGIAVYAQKGLSPKYLDKVEELATLNYLAFIITDESLCYGTNFPISNVILRDDLVVKLNMNEMFQLIGRAGRVGQSWTARAFLQQQGLQKLNDYIHKVQNQVNDQGRIFQSIADQHLNYPLLRLRNLQSEVRYLDSIENSEFIELQVKKKDAASHIIKNIVLVPFIQKQHEVKYLCKNSYKTFKYYNFPTSRIQYIDLPMIKNQQEQNIVDISAFYSSFKDFFYKTVDNTINRIIKENFNQEFQNYTIINHFKPKVYEPFFNSETNTLAILLQCSPTEKPVSEKYAFQTIYDNAFGESDDIIMSRINTILEDSFKISEIFEKNPLNCPYPDVRKCFANHQDVSNKEKARHYKEMIDEQIAIFSKGKYEQTIEKVKDKELLECREELEVMLAANQCADLRNTFDRLFHIPPLIRGVWKVIQQRAVSDKQ